MQSGSYKFFRKNLPVGSRHSALQNQNKDTRNRKQLQRQQEPAVVRGWASLAAHYVTDNPRQINETRGDSERHAGGGGAGVLPRQGGSLQLGLTLRADFQRFTARVIGRCLAVLAQMTEWPSEKHSQSENGRFYRVSNRGRPPRPRLKSRLHQRMWNENREQTGSYI